MAAGLVLPVGSCITARHPRAQMLSDFGIQLWTVKEAMLANPKEVLRQLAAFGYTQVESFEGEKGIFWGMSNTEFRDYVEDLGMKIIASHANVKENIEAKAAQATEIGMSYLINPYEGPQERLDDFKRMAERFNQYGEICKKQGIGFAYHNHDYSFKEMEGVIPHKLLLEQTEPDLVDFEMDIYWVITAGADPEAYLRNYPGRFKLGHIKDRIEGASEPFASTELGKGNINYFDILNTARANGMEYFIVEQERFDNSTPLESSRENARYMKRLKI